MPPLSTPDAATTNDVVDSRDLVRYYRADPAAADARFRDRRFRIRGTVQQFQGKAFRRGYTVHLDSTDPAVRIRCQFAYRSDWDAVHSADDDRRLVAKHGELTRTLLKNGEEAVFLGKCEGLRDGMVDFSGCTQILPELPSRLTPAN